MDNYSIIIPLEDYNRLKEIEKQFLKSPAYLTGSDSDSPIYVWDKMLYDKHGRFIGAVSDAEKLGIPKDTNVTFQKPPNL